LVTADIKLPGDEGNPVEILGVVEPNSTEAVFRIVQLPILFVKLAGDNIEEPFMPFLMAKKRI
jgi:hypothetical protein